MKLGHQVVVYALTTKRGPKEEIRDGLLIRRYGYPFVVSGWQPYLKRIVTHINLLFNLLKLRDEFDFVLGQGSPLLFARLYSAVHKVPIISVVHDVYGLEFSLASKGIIKGLARHILIERLLPSMHFDLWITVSKTTAAKLTLLGVSRDKVKIVYNGINPPEELSHGIRETKMRLCYLGRLVEHKHVEDLIEAFERLQKKFPDLELFIIGDGDQRQKLQDQANSAKLHGVFFTGFVPQQDKMRLLASSLCLVLPSTAEGWSVVLTEAAVLSVPSIAYDVPAVVEQASMIQSISIVPQRDIRSLEAAILALITDPERARRMGINGREAALTFTWERSARTLLAHIKDLSQQHEAAMK